MDSLKPFGWTLEKNEPAVVKHVFGPVRVLLAPLAIFDDKSREMVTDHDSKSHVTLTFKRDRHLEGKEDLNKLQLQYENCAKSIETLEASKKSGAAVAAYTIGLIGTVFMAFAMFGYLAAMTPAFIFPAVLGFLGWIIPFFAYKSLVARKTQKIDPLIENQHDAIYTICQKASNITREA